MKYRIIVNECRQYRVEKLVQRGHPIMEWKLCHDYTISQTPLEFSTREDAMDWIQLQIEAPEWERKRNTWTVVEEISDEQEKP